MNTHNLKRYMMPLFAFFIMFAGARAADYLWEPKLLWESKESYSTSTYGLRFINDDKEVLYSADQAIYVRDSETGEILRQTEKTTLDYSSFRLTKDKKVLYSSAATPNNPSGFRGLVSFDYATLKPIDSISIPWKLGTFDYNGVSLELYSMQEIIPISDTKVYLLFQTVNEPYPNKVIYGHCLVSFNPQKKDFSWDNKEDWKIEYYLSSNSLSFTDAPIITQDNKYLIGETPIGVKILDLETLKDYWNASGAELIAYNPNYTYIFIKTNDNRGKIINTHTLKEVFNFDYHILEKDGFTKEGICDLLIDSSRIMYYLPKEACYDLNTHTIINANKTGTGIPSPQNISLDETKYLGGGKKVSLILLNPCYSNVENNNGNSEEILYCNSNKLIIPINEIAPKEIIIFNADGKLIKQFSTFDADKENVYLNISFLNQGVYFVSVTFSNGNSENYKFLKGE